MKVYATAKNWEGIIVLRVWESQKEFSRTETWCDPKWILLCLSDTIESYLERRWGGIVYSKDKKQSHELFRIVAEGLK